MKKFILFSVFLMSCSVGHATYCIQTYCYNSQLICETLNGMAEPAQTVIGVCDDHGGNSSPTCSAGYTRKCNNSQSVCWCVPATY